MVNEGQHPLHHRWSKESSEAEKLLHELGIDTLPIDPFDIARRLNITLGAMPPSGKGASGMLMRVKNGFGIAYPTHLPNHGFVRFSVAHEIGHYCLPGHVDCVMDAQGQHKSQAGSFSGNRYEKEADNFAAFLLMPTQLFSEAMHQVEDGISGIEKLAKRCKTSLESTAIRYAHCSQAPVAVILSKGGYVAYAVMSSTLREFPNLNWIGKGTPVPQGTVTSRLNADIARVRITSKDAGTSNLDQWFDGCSQEINEEVLGLGKYGKTLTVLTSMVHPEEEEEDKGSWIPRFR